MKLDNLGIRHATFLVQAVHVLRYHVSHFTQRNQAGHCHVAGVGFCVGYQVVPAEFCSPGPSTDIL